MYIEDAVLFWELVERRATLSPDATMLIDEQGHSTSFAGYRDDAERLASALYREGIRSGHWVLWQLPTSYRAAVLIAALSRLEVVQNPLIHLYGVNELRAILAQRKFDYFIADAAAVALPEEGDGPRRITLPLPLSLEGAVPALPEFTGEVQRIRWVFYTSGTTAGPKGAMHTDRPLVSAGLRLAQSYGVGEGDVSALAFPIAHVGGPMYLVEMLASGAAALVMARFSGDEAARLFPRHQVSACGGSTAHYQALLEVQRAVGGAPLFPALRVLGGGGAARPTELYFRVREELDARISHTYGMTECPCVTVSPVNASDEALACTDGYPQPDIALRIVTPQGDIAKPGEVGEIRIRGVAIFSGYTDSALNEKAFDQAGYFRTGDLGYLREDGRLVVTGRIKDIIIRKGENISAQEIENLLYEHPAIRAVAVIGLPDSERGERVCAVIEPADSAAPPDLESIRQFMLGLGVMRQKIPEQVEIMAALPRNQTFNKVLKYRLLEMFSGQHTSANQSGQAT